MSAERKRDVDAAVQRIIDDLIERRSELSRGQIRTALASGLAAAGVQLSDSDLESWCIAIAAGENVRAEIYYC